MGKRRLHAVRDHAKPAGLDAEEANELTGLGHRVGQNDIGQIQKFPAPARPTRGHPLDDQLREVENLTRPVRGEEGDRPCLVPADRRKHDPDPPRPGHASQFEPSSRHAEQMEETGLFESVDPRGKEPDGDPQVLKLLSGLDKLVLPPPGRLERGGRGVEDD